MYRLWEQGYEVVEGIKASRGKESLLHKCSAGAFYKLISRCTHVDMQSSSDFKLLDRKVVDVLVALPEKDTFFRALSFWVGFKTASVEFEVEQRRFGQSKWSFKGLVNYAVQNITSFTTVPLQAVTFIGTVLLISSVVLGIQTLVKFLMGRAVEGFTTVSAAADYRGRHHDKFGNYRALYRQDIRRGQTTAQIYRGPPHG